MYIYIYIYIHTISIYMYIYIYVHTCLYIIYTQAHTYMPTYRLTCQPTDDRPTHRPTTDRRPTDQLPTEPTNCRPTYLPAYVLTMSVGFCCHIALSASVWGGSGQNAPWGKGFEHSSAGLQATDTILGIMVFGMCNPTKAAVCRQGARNRFFLRLP